MNWLGKWKQDMEYTMAITPVGFIMTDNENDQESYLKMFPNAEVSKENSPSSGTGFFLTKNGYFEGSDNHEDRIFLASTKEETGDGDFHIHICPIKEESYENFITLRNFLKNNPEKAQEYLKKKYEFAKEANFDRKKYKTLKSAYVSKLLVEAKK